MAQDVRGSLQYARQLYADVLGWYQSGETKAQVVIGLDGALTAFLTSRIFEKPEDLREIVAVFSPNTWLFLLLMAISLILSLSSAIYCLWSRIYSEPHLQAMIAKARRTGTGGELLVFFSLAGMSYASRAHDRPTKAASPAAFLFPI
jgi:hypothetical protein